MEHPERSAAEATQPGSFRPDGTAPGTARSAAPGRPGRCQVAPGTTMALLQGGPSFHQLSFGTSYGYTEMVTKASCKWFGAHLVTPIDHVFYDSASTSSSTSDRHAPPRTAPFASTRWVPMPGMHRGTAQWWNFLAAITFTRSAW